MSILTLTRNGFAICLAVQMVLAMQLSTAAQAEMLSTEAAIAKYSAYANRDFLLAEVRKQEIRTEIIALGVDPAEAEARLAVLSDEEIASIITQMEDDSAGADPGAGIVGILFTVFVILLVTDFLCLTKVFKFTRCL